MSDKNVFTPEALADKLLKNQPYWNSDSHDGGVTFSGGEPMLQSEFIAEAASILKSEQTHIVVDTSLYTNKEAINRLLTFVDLWMISVKHLDKDKHTFLTGVANTRILDNIGYLDQLTTKNNIRIRYLVIPTITDSKEYQDQMITFLKTIKHLDSVEILPYGLHGKHKWLEIVGEYPLEGIPASSKAQTKEIAEYFKTQGIPVKY
jgi:pyruvate formate lyase activating enzyme